VPSRATKGEGVMGEGFSVRGVVVLRAESHRAIRMWPEYGHAAIDFTCNEVVGLWKVYTYLEEKFGTGHVSEKEMNRGNGISQAKKSPTNLLGTKEFGRWSK
jgi:S-adenosylmethionine/arginine decarboxylase-like enzyme